MVNGHTRRLIKPLKMRAGVAEGYAIVIRAMNAGSATNTFTGMAVWTFTEE